MDGGVTPLCLAAACAQTDVVKVERPSLYGFLKDLFQSLVEFGAQVDSKMDNGATPMYMAAVNSHIDVVEV